MSANQQESPVATDSAPAGLLGSLRRMVGSALGLVETRLELISSDIAEARARIIQLTIVIAAALICFQVGVLLLLIALVLSVPEASRPAAVGIAGLVLVVAAVLGALWVRWRFKTRQPFFSATMAEFQKDRDRIRGKK